MGWTEGVAGVITFESGEGPLCRPWPRNESWRLTHHLAGRKVNVTPGSREGGAAPGVRGRWGESTYARQNSRVGDRSNYLKVRRNDQKV